MTFDGRSVEFIEEIKLLAAKYQVGLIGTCDAECQLGEIRLFDLQKDDQWHRSMKQEAFNFVY